MNSLWEAEAWYDSIPGDSPCVSLNAQVVTPVIAYPGYYGGGDTIQANMPRITDNGGCR
jgi:hypothetical protein